MGNHSGSGIDAGSVGAAGTNLVGLDYAVGDRAAGHVNPTTVGMVGIAVHIAVVLDDAVAHEAIGHVNAEALYAPVTIGNRQAIQHGTGMGDRKDARPAVAQVRGAVDHGVRRVSPSAIGAVAETGQRNRLVHSQLGGDVVCPICDCHSRARWRSADRIGNRVRRVRPGVIRCSRRRAACRDIGVVAPHRDVVGVGRGRHLGCIVGDRQRHRIASSRVVGVRDHGQSRPRLGVPVAEIPRVRRDVEIGARQKSREHDIGRGHDAGLIGRKRALQRAGLFLICAHVHNTATQARIAGQVGAPRHPGLVRAGIHGRAGQELVVAARRIHERRRGDIAGARWFGRRAGVGERAAGVVGDAREPRPCLVVQHNRVLHRAAVDAAALAGTARSVILDNRTVLDRAAVDTAAVADGRIAGDQAVANQYRGRRRIDAAAALTGTDAVVKNATVKNLPAGRVDTSAMRVARARLVPLDRTVRDCAASHVDATALAMVIAVILNAVVLDNAVADESSGHVDAVTVPSAAASRGVCGIAAPAAACHRQTVEYNTGVCNREDTGTGRHVAAVYCVHHRVRGIGQPAIHTVPITAHGKGLSDVDLRGDVVSAVRNGDYITGRSLRHSVADRGKGVPPTRTAVTVGSTRRNEILSRLRCTRKEHPCRHCSHTHGTRLSDSFS